MTPLTNLPFLFREVKHVETSTPVGADHREFHYDLLSFLSIAQNFDVDNVKITWQPALDELGSGSTALVQQAQVDALMHLAFKRSVRRTNISACDSDQIEAERFRALILELVALETLREHPGVIDLLGITWETDPATNQVWPVLLTERSTKGNMAEFLMSEDGHKLSVEAKLALCRDVADACKAMHNLGIAHGDIKLENVLVFLEVDHDQGPSEDREQTRKIQTLQAKVIDFGYSCLGIADHEHVKMTRTRPWQAPEHEKDRYFSLCEARKMDMYSFGMLLCRVFLPETMANLVSVNINHDLRDMDPTILDHLDDLKKGPEFLSCVEAAANETGGLSKEERDKLIHLFRLTLQHDQRDRATSFDEIVSILGEPPRINSAAIPRDVSVLDLAHKILDLGEILADIDDEDYLLHRAIFENLRRRVRQRPRCACYEHAVRQLWLCHEIGFGTKRDSIMAAKYWSQRGDPGSSSEHILEKINNQYVRSNPDRLERKLGYRTSLLFDPVTLYRQQGRLKMAEEAFGLEISARGASFGRQSRPYLSQVSLLALVVAESGDLQRAVDLSRIAAETSRDMYGMDDTETIGAFNYLSHMLFKLGNWEAVEELQLELIPCKERHKDLGPENQTTLSSQNTLVAVYCMQGRYEECLDVANRLVEQRRRQLGSTHNETLTTEVWICRTLLEKGDIEGLEERTTDLIRDNEKANGADDESTLQLQELLAAVLLSKATRRNSPVCQPTLARALDLIVQVLDRAEDGLMSEAPDLEDDDQDDSEDEEVMEVAVNLVLVLRATTTLICILAIQGDFVAAGEEIQDLRANTQALTGTETLEHNRLTCVIRDVALLESLLENPEGQDDEEVGLTRWKLANRWSTW